MLSSLDLPHQESFRDHILTRLRLKIFSKWALFFILILLVGYNVIQHLEWHESHRRDNVIEFLKSSRSKDNTQTPAERESSAILHPEDHSSRSPRVLSFDWTITTGQRSPDGVFKQVYLINGLFPGPKIEARPSDTIIVQVHNNLTDADDGLSFHWHGLYMAGYNHMDGAVGFTQCAINPGQSFTYKFNLADDQWGTYWYHAHSQVQRGDGLYGGFVIHKPNSVIEGEEGAEIAINGYKRELLLLVGDWYHQSAKEKLEWYTSARAFGNEPTPDSLVVNGRGYFECDMAVPAHPVNCTKAPRVSLEELYTTERFILRVINVGSLAGITLRVSNADIVAFQVDGGSEIVQETGESVGILYPGERVDLFVSFKAESRTAGSSLDVFLDPENLNYHNPALTTNQSFPIVQPNDSSRTTSNEAPIPQQMNDSTYIDLLTVRSNNPSTIPALASQTILLFTKTLKLAIFGNHPMGFINRTSWAPQSPPLLSLPSEQWDNNQLVPYISIDEREQGRWVDIIINNLDDGSHPFHLHGHSFYILASQRSTHGWGSYNPYSSDPLDLGFPSLEFNFDSPLKDTVAVPRRGFVVLRFLAENVGLWMLHCHVLVHQGSGMAMGLQVGKGERKVEVLDSSAANLCHSTR